MRRLPPVVLAMATLALGCPKSGNGESCEVMSDCAKGLICRTGICMVDPSVYRQQAQQSGVQIPNERPPSGGGGPGAVKVRTAHHDSVAFAICASDERLVGGWCDPPGFGSDNTDFTKQSVVGYSNNDTIGARWQCAFPGQTLWAFALPEGLARPRRETHARCGPRQGGPGHTALASRRNRTRLLVKRGRE